MKIDWNDGRDMAYPMHMEEEPLTWRDLVRIAAWSVVLFAFFVVTILVVFIAAWTPGA